MPSLRLQRVRELLKREVGEIIRREIPVADAGLVTVNDVTVSSDLHAATVYVGILGTADQKTKGFAALNQHRKRIQGMVGKAVILRYTPHLRFVVDQSIDQGNRVLKIIDELSTPRPPVKPHPQILDRILEGIRGSRTFCVVGHIRPDGDCIGSQLGLTLALKNEGKQVACWNEDPVPSKLAFLDPDHLVQRPRRGQKFDCVIATDAASFERLGKVGACINQRKLFINIDHHKSNTRYADINWVSAREPSSGEIIFRLLKVAGWPITPRIADCLFTAVSTDTGSFQYSTTRPGTYHVAGELVKRGADVAKICDEVYQSFPLSRVRLLKHVYNKFRLTHDNQIAYFWLKQADYVRTGAAPDDSEGLIDHIRAIAPVVVACLFEEVGPGMTRISLRSKSDRVNVNEIAGLFGGGGHMAAAGARIEGPPLSVQRRVIAAIKKALDRAAH